MNLQLIILNRRDHQWNRSVFFHDGIGQITYTYIVCVYSLSTCELEHYLITDVTDMKCSYKAK